MPAPELSSWAQLIAATIGVVGGGTVAGHKYGFATGVAVLLGALLILTIRGGISLQRDLDRQVSERPHISTGEPFTRVAEITDGTTGCFVLIPISNHRAVGAQSGTDARNVHGRLRLVTETGSELTSWQQARWSHTPQQITRGPYAPVHDASVTEYTLPANGRAVDFDTVVQRKGHDGCDLWTQSGMYELGIVETFRVELELEGSNVPKQKHVFRVTPGTAASFDPTAEKVG